MEGDRGKSGRADKTSSIADRWKDLLISVLIGLLIGMIGGLGLFQFSSPWSRERGEVVADINYNKLENEKLRQQHIKDIQEIKETLNKINDNLQQTTRELSEIKGLLRRPQ